MTRLTTAFGLLLSASCASAPPRENSETTYHRYGPLEVSAQVEQDRADVMGAVDLMNPTGETVGLAYAGECGVAILVYRQDDTNTTAIWDSSRWWAGEGDCPAGTIRMDIPPETLARILTPVVSAGGILGDSLPSGSYRTAVRLRLLLPRDTVLILPAGRIDLESGGEMPALVRTEARLQP